MRRSRSRALTIVAVGVSLLVGSPALASPDTDLDGVPDVVDNCQLHPNGPAELSNQVDTDGDGYGNACDADFNQDFQTTNLDFTLQLSFLESLVTGSNLALDLDGDGAVTLADVRVYLEFFGSGQPPGPSGLVP